MGRVYQFPHHDRQFEAYADRAMLRRREVKAMSIDDPVFCAKTGILITDSPNNVIAFPRAFAVPLLVIGDDGDAAAANVMASTTLRGADEAEGEDWI